MNNKKTTYRGLNLPVSFRIENYDILETLSAQQIINELMFRVRFLQQIRDTEEEIEFFFPNTPEWQSIQAGKILVTKVKEKDNNVCPCLPKMVSVESLSIQSIEWYSYYAELCQPASNNKYLKYLSFSALSDEEYLSAMCFDCTTELFSIDYQDYQNDLNINCFCTQCTKLTIDRGYVITEEDETITEICSTCTDPTLDVSKDPLIHDLLLGIDLKQQTDREILASVAKILEIARDKYHIPELIKLPSKLPSKYFEKIITYKIIPYLDLKLWWLYCSVSDNPLVEFDSAPPASFGLNKEPKYIPTLTSTEINEIIFNKEKSDSFINETLIGDNLPKYMDWKYLRLAQIIINEKQAMWKSPRPLKIKDL